MTQAPRVTVVVETYNLREGASRDGVVRGLRSVLDPARRLSGDVVLAATAADAASLRDDVDHLGEGIRIVVIDESGTYDGMKRRAASSTDAPFVAFLDSDCEPVDDGWLQAHLDTLGRGAVASAGITRYRGGWWASLLSILDFGFLLDAPADEAGCYASNNAAFDRRVFLETCTDGPLRSNCFLHSQGLLRRRTPVQLTPDAVVLHDLPPFRAERRRQGSDMVVAARATTDLPESRYAWAGANAAPFFYAISVGRDWQRALAGRRTLSLGMPGLIAALLAIPFVRVLDLAGIVQALRAPRPIAAMDSFDGELDESDVSVCIVSAGRTEQLTNCLVALAAQSRVPGEVLVCANGDPSVDAVVQEHYPDAKVVQIPRATPGSARNALLGHAGRELLLFLDDDVVPPPDLIAGLVDVAREHPECTVFGGPNETPPRRPAFDVVQGAVLASRVGGGIARQRFGTQESGPADDRQLQLCNLAVRRRAMLPFEDDLVCAEENALLHSLRQQGVAMWHDARLMVWHERRGTVRGFVQQAHKFGRGRGQLLRRRPSTFRAAYLAPTALLAWLVAFPFLRRRVPRAGLPVATYAAAVAASSAKIGLRLRRPSAVPRAAALTAALHASYGVGVVRGWWEEGSRRRTSARGPRGDDVEILSGDLVAREEPERRT